MGSIKPVRAAYATAHCRSAGVAAIGTTNSTPECASAKNPVDLVHLSRQTLGDRSLENEVLQLFVSQSRLFLDRLDNASTASERKLAAHTVLGSARSLGAWRVAEEASIVEQRCEYGCDTSALHNAINEANSYINSLLEG